MGRPKKRNSINIVGDIAEIICVSRDGMESKLIIDKDSIPLVSGYRWRVNMGYGVSHEKIEDSYKRVYLHRLIMNVGDKIQVDHINFNRSDCRKENMRLCSHFQNVSHKSNNTSGVCGVNLRKGKWRAYIYIYGENKKPKQIYLGDYKDKDDAIRARKEAEIKYYGQNSFEIAEPTPKYFSHLESRIDAFFWEDGEDGIDLVKRTGRIMRNL